MVESFVPRLFLLRYVDWMADEDDIRELIGRLTAAQRQGFHVTPSHIRLVLIGLRFYLATRTWLAKPPVDRHDDAPRRKPEAYTGPPATIADLKARGLVAFTVDCEGPQCHNQRRVTFEALGVDDGTPFPTSRSVAVYGVSAVDHGGCGCRRIGRIMLHGVRERRSDGLR